MEFINHLESGKLTGRSIEKISEYIKHLEDENKNLREGLEVIVHTEELGIYSTRTIEYYTKSEYVRRLIDKLDKIKQRGLFSRILNK